jgi:hypothetical protein
MLQYTLAIRQGYMMVERKVLDMFREETGWFGVERAHELKEHG